MRVRYVRHRGERKEAIKNAEKKERQTSRWNIAYQLLKKIKKTILCTVVRWCLEMTELPRHFRHFTHGWFVINIRRWVCLHIFQKTGEVFSVFDRFEMNFSPANFSPVSFSPMSFTPGNKYAEVILGRLDQYSVCTPKRSGNQCYSPKHSLT